MGSGSRGGLASCSKVRTGGVATHAHILLFRSGIRRGMGRFNRVQAAGHQVTWLIRDDLIPRLPGSGRGKGGLAAKPGVRGGATMRFMVFAGGSATFLADFEAMAIMFGGNRELSGRGRYRCGA